MDLLPVPVTTSPVRRLPQLLGGLVLYGASMGLMIRSGLGLDPWDVLHEALAERTGLTFGTVTAIVGALVLLCWIPLRQRPGVGTVANILVIAAAVDLTLAVLTPPSALAPRIVLMVAGVVLNGLASAAYIGVRLGPGPRDGLMTGLNARAGWSIRIVRTAIELTVLTAGWLLGGTAGVGTVLYALAIGPLVQAFLPYVTWRGRA
ncbi:YczE/YyaS/YitT family protein [Actinophytocola glycyrrhizae]|uniref:YitT family protein n=1 Tax=Actinophytocola glycyrrhizae TaxID=2044873 RepID=A0ABV9SBP2_9PSEU